MIDNATGSCDYVDAEALTSIKVPARSIRTGCTVTVFADEILPAVFTSRAFARRARIEPSDASLADLLTKALGRAKDDQQRSAVAAAAGIGIFPHNENVYGYPALGTDQTFLSPTLKTDVAPLPSPADGLAAVRAATFKVTVAGQSFIASGTPIPVDWSADPDNIAKAAKVTLSSGGPAKALADGRVDGYPGPREAEWTTNGEKAGAWAKFTWPAAQTIDRVILFDRPNPNDRVTAGTITFSDGSIQTFGELENDAAHGTEVRFEPKTITWLKITVTGTSPATENIGLAEVVVLKPSAK
jgi:hypothetical protein